MSGFSEFFKQLTEEESKEYFEISTSMDSIDIMENITAVEKSLDKIITRLRMLVLGIIGELNSPEEKALAFAFPEEFDRLNQAVLFFA